MKLPEMILIRDAIYQVQMKRLIEPADKRGLATLGVCDPGDHMIYIKTGQTFEQRLQTLVHEVLHAIEEEWNIDIPHTLIRKLEEPISRILIDNWI